MLNEVYDTRPVCRWSENAALSTNRHEGRTEPSSTCIFPERAPSDKGNSRNQGTRRPTPLASARAAREGRFPLRLPCSGQKRQDFPTFPARFRRGVVLRSAKYAVPLRLHLLVGRRRPTFPAMNAREASWHGNPFDQLPKQQAPSRLHLAATRGFLRQRMWRENSVA